MNIKIFLGSILTFSLAFASSTAAFADSTTPSSISVPSETSTSNTLTPEQQQARDDFEQVYMDKMAQIVQLRVDTASAEQADSNILQQIKDDMKTIKASNTSQNADAISQVKAIAKSDKDLSAQIKTLETQKAALKKQYNSAVKAKDIATMKTLETQILDLTKQMETIKSQIQANKIKAQPFKDELTAARTAEKEKMSSVKSLTEQIKTQDSKIKGEVKAKDLLWKTYNSDVKSKNYTDAGNVLQSIIDAKTQIISDIKAKEAILNNVLSGLNSLIQNK